jgi:hypothetical protein
MELDRLSTGEKISAVSAVLLFIVMFFDWFGVEVSSVEGFSGSVPGAGGSAWDALDIIPLFLMLTIVVALGVAIVRLTDADLEPPVSLNTIVAVLGGLSILLILYRIINPPDFDSFGGVEIDTTLKLGIFLGLLTALGIAYGGYSAMREEGATFGDAADRLSSGGGAAPPPGSPNQPASTPPPAPPAQPPGQQAPPPPPQQQPPQQQPPPPPPGQQPPPQ